MEFLKETKNVFKNTWQHFITGNSYMLPVLIIGGVISSICSVTEASDSQAWQVLNQVGQIGMKYFVPFMAAYVAYSVADMAGVAPGLICGILAQQYELGYIGAFIGGLLVGYFTYILLNINVKSIFQGAWGMFVPVIATILTSLILILILGNPISWIVKNGTKILLSFGRKGGAFMGAIIGVLGGVDFGGTFSKIQSTFSTMVISQEIFTPLGICGAIATVPPLGMCLAVLISPKLYSEDDLNYAKESWFTALLTGVTEVIFPFLQEDTVNVTIASAIGCIVTGIIAGANSLKLYVPVLGFLQWFFYDKPLIYFTSVFAGIVTVAITANLLKRINKKE